MTLKQMRERVIHARARLARYHAEQLIAEKRVKHYEKTYKASAIGSAKRKRQGEKLHDWRKRHRQLKQHIAHWQVIVGRRDEALKELLSETPRLVAPNLIEGGTPVERFELMAHKAVETARDFYSETGAEDDDAWAITNVPDDSYRSDCSKWSQVSNKTIQIPDPTGTNFGPMFTGTVVANCEQVDRAFAEANPGTAVVFGSGNGFHMGRSMGHGTNLIVQHGVPPVQWGTFDEFGSGTEVRFYKFLT
jgi:hypothetical protein